MNVEVGTTVYPDRAYVSSPQRGAITYVNAAMSDTYAPVDLVNQIPPMTDYTVPSGVALASSEINTGSRAWLAFDRSTASRWISAGLTGWVRYDFGTGNAKIINHYSITSMATGDNYRNPKTWTFEGSNDGTTFTTLDTETNAAQFSAGEVRMFTSTNTTAYRYYRVNITAPQATTDYCAIMELQMFSTIQTTTEMQIKVDSARYVKVGMEIDIYKAGTDTKLYTLVPTSVDNSKDTFNFLPISQNMTADVTDIITVTDTTLYPTETPVKFTTNRDNSCGTSSRYYLLCNQS